MNQPRAGGRPLLAIWEPVAGGHHLFYVRHIADYFINNGWRVLWYHCGGTKESAEFAYHLADLVDSGSFGDAEVPTPDLKSVLRRATEDQVQHLIIPDGDHQLARIARVAQHGPGTVTLLVTRNPLVEPWRGRRAFHNLAKVGVSAYVHQLKAQVRVGVLESPYGTPTVRPLLGMRMGIPVPDPVDFDATELQASRFRERHLPRDRVWLCIAGTISSRKNVVLTLQALAQLDGRRYGLVLAGRVDETYRERVLGAVAAAREVGIETVTLDMELSNNEMSVAIAASDITVIAYSTSNPPSSFGKALAARTPAILAGSRQLQSYAKAFPGRVVTCDLDVDSLSGAIEAVQKISPPPPPAFPAAADFASALGPPGARPRSPSVRQSLSRLKHRRGR